MAPFTIDETLNEQADECSEEVFDEEFNEIISCIDTTERTVVEDVNLPEIFDTKQLIEKLTFESPVTSMQLEINQVASCLFKPANLEKVKIFCAQEFSILKELLENSNILLTETVPVTPDKLTLFYTKCQQHQISTAYKARTLLMMDNIPDVTSKVISHVAFQLTVAVRTFLLKEKEQNYPVAERETHKRSLTTASLGKIRYVGGYCLAKLRYKHQKIQYNKCYKTSSEDQAQYKKSSTITQILDTMRVSEASLQMHTEHPETLLETAQRQNVSRSLTNITDKLFQFFIDLCENCLTYLVDKNLNVQGSEIYNVVAEKIVQSLDLYEKFVHIASSSNAQDFNIESTINCVMYDTIDRVCAIEEIFNELVKKFLLVMLNQYRKDFLQMLSVLIKMAHRKQIQVKSKALESKVANVDFAFIKRGQSEGKSVSNQILKGLILQQPKYLSSLKKKKLLLLCKAYNVPMKSAEKKDGIIKSLNSKILESGSILKPEFLQETIHQEEEQATYSQSDQQTSSLSEQQTSSQLIISEESESTSQLESVDPVDVPVADTSDTEQDNELCKVCDKKESSSNDWISCDSCGKWLHRKCAGLSNNFKWKRFSRKNVQFICQTCK